MQFLSFFSFLFLGFWVFFSSRRRVRWKWWTFLFVLFFFVWFFWVSLFFFNLKSTVRSTTGSVEFFFKFYFFFRFKSFASFRCVRFSFLLGAFASTFPAPFPLPPFPAVSTENRPGTRNHVTIGSKKTNKQTNKTKQQNKEKTGSMMSIRIDPVPSNRCSRSRAVKCGKTM